MAANTPPNRETNRPVITITCLSIEGFLRLYFGCLFNLLCANYRSAVVFRLTANGLRKRVLAADIFSH